MELGTGGFESNRVKKVYFTLEDGDNAFRILPAMGNLAAKNVWSKFYRVEFGYYNTKGKMQVFQCPRVVNFQTKMVEVESAAYQRREKLLKARDAVVEFLKANPGNAQKESEREKLNTLLKQFNSDGKFYVNAMDLNGRIGLLKLGKTAFDDLKNEMRKLNDTGVNPLSADTGRFFVINKTGQLRDTAYKVTLFKENKQFLMPDGTSVTGQVDVVHKLTPDIISRLKEEAFKLDEIYPYASPEQVERIVAGEAVDVVMPYVRAGSTETEAKTYAPKTTYAQRADNAPDEAAIEKSIAALETNNFGTTTAEIKIEAPKAEIARPTVINTPVEAPAKVAAKASVTNDDDIDALLAQVMLG
jgi:hypothetical protein